MNLSRNAFTQAASSLPPVFALDAAQPGMAAQDNIDEDWAEFLSLGMEVDPAEVGGGWKNSPVLLSY